MTVENTYASNHVVGIVGGATAGSEIARILVERGALVIVFEQNPRPYGKIEDGLPRWHVKQRKDEYENINARLDRSGIEYVPLTRLGRDLSFDELRLRWGLSALVLTHGAWRDRPFPVGGADEYTGRGLLYQNPFIYWFNHYPEASYNGPRYEIAPGAIVVGGGLASLDVVKVLQLETTLAELRARGIDEDMLHLERAGIEPVLGGHGLTWADLGVRPCKLIYRRRVLDMPLSDIPAGIDPKRAQALRHARAKILEKAQAKYRFEFQELSLPTGLITAGGRLCGLRLSRTEVVGSEVRVVAGSEHEMRAGLVVSSIGSIPEPLPGIPRRGEVYQYADQKVGLLLEGSTAVFAAGNVLTGKGNIKDSLDSGTEIGHHVAESYLGLADHKIPLYEADRARAEHQGHQIGAAVAERPPLAAETVAAIMRRVRERQRAVGYEGKYREWIRRVTPPDLQ